MQKHYLDAPDITGKESQNTGLPDKSNLGKLYPSANPHTPAPSATSPVSHTQFNALFFILVGALLPLPFLAGKAILELLLASLRASDIFFALPGIVITIIVWVGLMVLLYIKLSKAFYRRGLDVASFLMYQLSCLAFVTPLIYSSTVHFQTRLFSQALFGLILVIVSALLAWLFLSLAARRKMTPKTAVVLLACVLFICMVSAIIYLIQTLA